MPLPIVSLMHLKQMFSVVIHLTNQQVLLKVLTLGPGSSCLSTYFLSDSKAALIMLVWYFPGEVAVFLPGPHIYLGDSNGNCCFLPKSLTL